ncbi:MAG: class I SAM-dependent RNA methyltransferase, partial [Planctomycetes bacterium]|nr:class I SAM-dependent RNA methyltransferase [Planctomycetota bacterium]
MKIPEESTILISCGRGLVPYLKSEIETLGYETTTERMTDVEIVGTMWDAMLLNIHLRTAYCVFFKLTGFECATPDQLYANVKSIPWEDLIAPSQYVSVSSRVDTPSIDNTMFASLKVKDAIVDRIKSVTGKRPDSGPDRHRVVVQLYWKNNEAIIYMNTSGVKISDRGYRKLPHSAPLRESRAAAVIQATGYDGSCPLVNPMCGSGTLAIEAALIAM